MTWSVSFLPLVPPWLIATLAAVAVLLLAYAFYRRIRGTWVRVAAVAAMVLALLNPFVLREDREPLPTVVALVSDESASQTLDGRDETTEAAHAALAESLKDFRGVELREIRAGGDVNGVAVDGTRLFDAIGASLADVPPDRIGAVVMLTDGQVHDVPTDPSKLAPGAPFHALLSGHDEERDRRIVIDSAMLPGPRHLPGQT